MYRKVTRAIHEDARSANKYVGAEDEDDGGRERRERKREREERREIAPRARSGPRNERATKESRFANRARNV